MVSVVPRRGRPLENLPSNESAFVEYAGHPLTSGQRCHWKVQVWDENDRPSRWSKAAAWEMGLMRPEDWKADWIGAGPTQEPLPPHGFFRSTNELAQTTATPHLDPRSILLRKEFALRPAIRRACAYVSGLGYYEFHCNGRKVDDRVLAPSKSNYRQWVFYDTYDLTPLLRPGANALGVMLGNGWFNPPMRWWEPYRMQWFGSPRARVQVHVEYADGASEIIVSDPTWKTFPGPVLDSNIYDGEIYDATQEASGWNAADLNDREWRPARVVEAPGGAMVSQLMPPMRITEQIRPVAIRSLKPGVQIVDLGRNISGWIRLRVSGARSTRLTLRYAEDIHPDGTLDPTSNERARSTDTFVLKGEGTEFCEPHFTFHGFRYVEISGAPKPISPNDVTGCFVHTDCQPTGSFACDNDLINRIHRATVRSQRSCMLGYPADCPQRDERLGWLGDAMVTADEMLLNFDAAVFQRQWLEGIRFNQNPTNGDISIVSPRPYTPEEPDPIWSSAYPVMVWELYRQQGDHRFLSEHFDAVCRFVDYLGTQATNHILPRYWIGDWGSIIDGWKEGDPPSVTTAFYYLDATLAARMAKVLGRSEAVAKYETLAGEIRAAFQQTYYDAERHRFDQGTLFSNALPIVLGLADPQEASGVLGNILAELDRRGGHFDVGVLGTKYLPEALTLAGRADRAFALATMTGYPSWAHLLEGGRDTLSEFWDLHGSHNHVMLGSIDAWFYRTLAGIQPDDDHPGYHRIDVRPYFPESLGRVDARVETVRGPLRVHWVRRGKTLRLSVDLPPNVEASIHLPVARDCIIDSRPRRSPASRDDAAAVFRVGSGHYEFQFEPTR
ncbi:MAG: family 78 glycoside hydrolase catalytic domain [Verrucomicrobiales bacterium]|nr:family 78 glycoside hydrolase catalytic domain [Verrucomicrobiales bacterium]